MLNNLLDLIIFFLNTLFCVIPSATILYTKGQINFEVKMFKF